jgi:hypothetical protein
LVDAVLARVQGRDVAVPAWSLATLQQVGLATGLTALAGSLGLFDDAADDVVAYVREQQGQVQARADRFAALTPKVLAALAAADLCAVPVKGAVLGGSADGAAVWPSPGARPMSDIDVLVPARYRAQAGAALARAGWSLHATEPHEDTFLAWGDGSVGRTDGESADHNGRVEVHPGWVEFIHGYTANGFDIEAHAERRADGQWRLGDTAFAVHVVGHLASTVVRAEVRAVNVLDVWFLQQRGLDWEAMAPVLRSVDARLTGPGLWLVDRFVPGLVPSDVLRGELARLRHPELLIGLEAAAVLRDPTQRTTSRWRSAFAQSMGEQTGVARQLGRSVVGRFR